MFANIEVEDVGDDSGALSKPTQSPSLPCTNMRTTPHLGKLWEAQAMDLEILKHMNKFCSMDDSSNDSHFLVTDDGLYYF